MKLDKLKKRPTQDIHTIKVEFLNNEGLMEDYPASCMCSPFKVKHIKTLAYASGGVGEVLRTYVAVLQELTDIDVMELTFRDFDILLLSLRVNSCGSSSEYSVKCAACGKTSHVEVNYTELDIRPLPDNFEDPCKLSDGTLVQIPRMSTEIESKEHDAKDLDILAKYLVEGDTFKDKLELLNDMDPKMLSEMSKYVSTIGDVGVLNEFSFICNSLDNDDKVCTQEEMILIPFRGKFFIPSR